MDINTDVYKEEAYELLAGLETSLLSLEESPNDLDLIGSVFRSMHTIKGSGAMFGFDNIAEFTHEIETVFDIVRNGKMSVTSELISLTFKACDIIRKMLDEDKINESEKKEVLDVFKEIVSISKIEESKNTEPLSKNLKNLTYRIKFKPLPQILSTGSNPILLLNELRELGVCKIIARLDKIPELNKLNPEFCYIYWDIILNTDKGIDAIKDVFIFVEDSCELEINVIDDDDNVIEDDKSYKFIGEILVEKGEISEDLLKKALEHKKKLGDILIESKAVNQDSIESALVEQECVRDIRKKKQECVDASSIRVSAEKLDGLVNLVGELVTVQARLTQKAFQESNPELTLISEAVGRLTSELRDNTMNIRMMPIGTTFSRFKRLVRDLCHELNKEVDFIAEGGETELDKTVVERLNDPLIHIIRNSLDHGIESSEIRKLKGKPARGKIALKAFHSGPNVFIQITDDGAGIDKNEIRQKSIEKGLILPDLELTDKEIFDKIFLPGFSTAKKLTGISGRGVGMDVVKRSIDGLRGIIELISEKDIGTTITLKLPLTLAIIDGLLVNIGETNFVFPLSVIKECIDLTSDDIKKSHGRNLANVRGNLTSYINLREIFNINGNLPSRQKIVITDINNYEIGFVVDRVIGQHQTVIKSLGRIYKDVHGISGATILGDGSVALILDVYQLIQIAEKEEINIKI
ncbi:MAG: chemotaxis protein CheA [Desulfobacterales bacterium]|nr:chemotaxis protein CheA [Desulfobacterales bacterium]